MTAPDRQSTCVKSGISLRRSIWIFVAALALTLLTFLAAYFRQARLDNGVRYAVCSCGLKRAKIVNGEVVLIEPNHARPAGSIVATIEIEDGRCIFRRIKEDGTVGNAESYEVDHLGAKYHHETFGVVYIIMADNWKLYPAAVFARVESMLR